MSHITLAREGLEAVKQRRWDEAVTKLTTAVKGSPNPTWIVARSKAMIGLQRHEDALHDAELAWHYAYQRSSRSDLMDSQFRRGVAYYHLGQFANADCCCFYAMRMAKGYPAVEDDDPKLPWVDEQGHWTVGVQKMKELSQTDPFNIGHTSPNHSKDIPFPFMNQAQGPHILAWRRTSLFRLQILRAMEALPEEDEARLVKVNQVPSRKPYDKYNTLPPLAAAGEQADASAEPRMQEFQTPKTITVSIFSKGIDESKFTVDFQPSYVRLQPVVYPDGSSRPMHLSLWADIDPSCSRYFVTPCKVELQLYKEGVGKWPQLTKDEAQPADEASDPKSNVTDGVAKKNSHSTYSNSDKNMVRRNYNNKRSRLQKEKQTSGPSYPTSSRSGPKDWDKIASGNGADEDDDPDVNAFFKKLYENATLEQRRAMMKSFTESNGTSLSTDWNDVKGRKVETVPPEGMEAKKY
ncbi:hypothetical protein L249_3742 [Ophiocordyceps polyrhachis-furcata BCC 54312]|uniref:CS domain-containing protein n=1 Tax=Ophiocordyceps polyrhachis-furcata BCC 54312 TaxID=1330021 RepID=A0A367L553_9HYPO|nr:hypothetical protein L249_3742 [Ophiocordyceps polyrhachis-furcata BCC 54312]